MPCYSDIPDEDDQAEIETRCKVRMYFDVQTLMTTDQCKESQKQNISMFPPMKDTREAINQALCKLCHILQKEQMEKISAYYYQIKWSHNTLYDWYVQHCKDDINFNKGNHK